MKIKGIATIGLQVVIGAICTWCAGLSIGLFNQNAQLASIGTAFQDFKESQTTVVYNQQSEIQLLTQLAQKQGIKISSTTDSY